MFGVWNFIRFWIHVAFVGVSVDFHQGSPSLHQSLRARHGGCGLNVFTKWLVSFHSFQWEAFWCSFMVIHGHWCSFFQVFDRSSMVHFFLGRFYISFFPQAMLGQADADFLGRLHHFKNMFRVPPASETEHWAASRAPSGLPVWLLSSAFFFLFMAHHCTLFTWHISAGVCSSKECQPQRILSQ